MHHALESARYESTGYRMYLLALYYLLSGNFSLVVVLFGLFIIILGMTVVESIHPVFAGMFGIGGMALIIMGSLAYAMLWANEVYARMTAGS